jgi:DNA invertase Pin-like site-specific DNA recombinase
MTPHSGKYVAYYRVSTKRQGQSGLGVEAQREMVQQFLNGGDWDLVDEYTETESGKRSDRHRPQLRAALERCRREGATLIVAKIDRLTRNLGFLTKVTDSGVPMVACDVPNLGNPAQNKFLLQLMANVAEYEGALISERTKAALAAAKKRGVVLGSPDPVAASHLGGVEVNKSADDFARRVGPVIEELQDYGCLTLREIAKGLEARGVKTARENPKWSLSAVRNVRLRYEEIKKNGGKA